MQSASAPNASSQRIPTFTYDTSNEITGEGSSGYETVTDSWTTSQSISSIGAVPQRPPLAWSGVRHQVIEEESSSATAMEQRGMMQCSQAVLLTCLHLSHEMVLRDVGLYAWTIPIVKDPAGSMLRITKRYAQQLCELSTSTELNVRTAPDPSKSTIQNRLQKARLAAGPDAYVTVLYSGHGIQEPPTEAGELWCYDRSFEECAQQGGGPSEYIPILLFDVLTWAGSASCYVWDCQHSGRLIRAALTEAEEIDTQLRAAAEQNPHVSALLPAVYAKRQIHFAACGANQVIPRVTGLPDDIFTACLTTPLRIALLHHNLQTFPLVSTDATKYVQKSHGYMAALLDHMSETLKTRLWLELQAILNTIAWQTIGGADYQMLFGQSGDVISTLAAGFILSQRVLGAYRTNPESIPAIPSSTSHPLWIHWDLILDNLFEQLPPYFDEEGDQSWEANLKLVSFMDDQLASILETDQALFAADIAQPGGTTSGLSRLPIICKAALVPDFRVRACTALDSQLRNLDVRGLTHAVQGGALDVAAQLLALEDESIGSQMISIWSSLIRHEVCVSFLATSGKTAEKLTSVPCVKFFLDALEKHLTDPMHHSRAAVVRTAAVLATIAIYVSGREAPRFSARTLRLASEMLNREDGLVKQWGAILIAEVVGSINKAKHKNEETLVTIKQQLLLMSNSSVVETRGTAVYALSQWVDPESKQDILMIRPEILLSVQIGPQCRTDGSPLVRKEIVRLLQKVMMAGGKWTKLVFWIFLLESASKALPKWERQAQDFVKAIGARTGMGEGDERKVLMKKLNAIVRAFDVLRCDPDSKVAGLVSGYLLTLLDGLKDYLPGTPRATIGRAVFGTNDTISWTDGMFEDIMRAGEFLLQGWDAAKGYETSGNLNSKELFEESILSMEAYLENDDNSGRTILDGNGKPANSQDREYALRFRLLENALVVAEQQVGLPWCWNIKDFETVDPWSSVTFHSFLNTAVACNNSQDLLIWDWSSSRKTERIHLNIPKDSIIESASIVNELFETIVVLAKISNGDIHVLSAAPDTPHRLTSISSFPALRVDKSMLKRYSSETGLITTWWRQTGQLAVGGMSETVNVWDCPAERCRTRLSTGSDMPLTTLITEPVSGNILLGGLADGKVKLWDTRQSRVDAVLEWQGDLSQTREVDSGKSILKLGVVLGESKYITSACSNGLINIHDLRNLSVPTTSTFVHPRGISSASFQAHSGLMSTTSQLFPAQADQRQWQCDWSLYRSCSSSLTEVSSDTISLGAQQVDVVQQPRFKPYTTIHDLRPFLGIGYGRKCYLRGSGVGQGDDTDSGSYSFLRAQSGLGARTRGTA